MICEYNLPKSASIDIIIAFQDTKKIEGNDSTLLFSIKLSWNYQ